MSKNNKIEKFVIYQVNQTENTKYAKLKPTGYIFSNDELLDQQLVINYKEHKNVSSYPINEEVYIKYFKCNNTSFFIMQNTKLPIYSSSIYYQKKFITGYLMSIFIYFVIKNDIKNIKSFDQLLNTELEGEYVIEVIVDDKTILTEKLETIGNNDEVFNYIMNLVENNKNIIDEEMNKRDNERKTKYGEFINYSVNKPVFNYNDLVNAYKNGKNIDEFLDKL